MTESLQKAKRGNWVEIVKPEHSWGLYDVGDKFKVTSRWGNDEGVYVRLNRNYELELYDREYVVIDKPEQQVVSE